MAARTTPPGRAQELRQLVKDRLDKFPINKPLTVPEVLHILDLEDNASNLTMLSKSLLANGFSKPDRPVWNYDQQTYRTLYFLLDSKVSNYQACRKIINECKMGKSRNKVAGTASSYKANVSSVDRRKFKNSIVSENITDDEMAHILMEMLNEPVKFRQDLVLYNAAITRQNTVILALHRKINRIEKLLKLTNKYMT